MFYSHEILTNRKYGVATVWLVATLGSKSSLKKVNRRAILDVNIPKACETILGPEAPMALRLQGSLLFGVSRVHSQQCAYVLADAQSIHNNIRQLLRAVRTSHLDLEPGRMARPDQLVLQDDPTFVPDLALASLDSDLSGLEFLSAVSRRSAKVHSSGETPMSDSTRQPIPGIIIPPFGSESSDNVDRVQLGKDDSFLPGRMSDLALSALDPFIDDGDRFLQDPGFTFDEEGNLQGLDALEMTTAPSVAHPARSRAGSNTSVFARIEQEHEEARNAEGRFSGYNDNPRGNDILEFADVEPWPERPGSQAQNSSNLHFSHEINEQQEELDRAEYIEAPMIRRPRNYKTLTLDRFVELGNSAIKDWNENYLANMVRANEQKLHYRAASLAKKNADYWMWGTGIGGIGKELGGVGLPNKMDLFYGQAFKHIVNSLSAGPAGQKRRHGANSESETTEEQGRRVRSRKDLVDGIVVDDDALAIEDAGLAPIIDDEDPEIGRTAPTPLAGDHDVSSTMPWNIHTASQRGSSVRPTTLRIFPTEALASSSSVVPFLTSIRGPSRGNRVASASPLHRRGLQPEWGKSSRQTSLSLEPAPGTAGQGITWSAERDHLIRSQIVDENDGRGGEDGVFDEFEMFGPAANVDTQTAAVSQWVRDALDHESDNFLRFLEATIHNIAADAMEEEHNGTDAGPGSKGVTFNTLLPPSRNTRIVAAQGLLHVLALASKGLLHVLQDVGFGDITLNLSAAAA